MHSLLTAWRQLRSALFQRPDHYNRKRRENLRRFLTRLIKEVCIMYGLDSSSILAKLNLDATVVMDLASAKLKNLCISENRPVLPTALFSNVVQMIHSTRSGFEFEYRRCLR